jgi:hypothetical protein
MRPDPKILLNCHRNKERQHAVFMFELIEYKIGNFPFFNRSFIPHNAPHRISFLAIQRNNAGDPSGDTFE